MGFGAPFAKFRAEGANSQLPQVHRQVAFPLNMEYPSLRLHEISGSFIPHWANARINCGASWTFFCAFGFCKKSGRLTESDLMRLLAIVRTGIKGGKFINPQCSQRLS